MSFTKNNLLLTTSGFYDFETLSQKESVSIITDVGLIDVKIIINEMMMPVRSLIISDGSQIECGYGQFFLIGKDDELNKILPNEAKRSKDGNPLIKMRGLRPLQNIECGGAKLFNFQESFNFPFIHGYCCGAALLSETQRNGEKIKDFIIDSPPPEILNHKDMISDNGSISLPNIIKSYQTPFNSNINIKIEWLNGFLLNKLYIENSFVCFNTNNHILARDIKILLYSLGVESTLEYYKDFNEINDSGTLFTHKMSLSVSEYNKLVNLGLTFQGLKGVDSIQPKIIKNITDSYKMSITYRIEKNIETSDIHVCYINGISVPI